MTGIELLIAGFLVIYLVVFIKTLLFHAYLWQNKEYLPSRLLNELTTPQGQKYYLTFSNITKLFLLVLYFPFPNLRLFFNFVIIAIFINDFFSLISALLNKTLKKPKRFTLKIVFIALLSIIFSTFILFTIISFKTPILYALLFIERVTPPLVFIFVLFSKIPTKVAKKIIIYQAKQKLKQFPNLKIIGITGSFGKTSVKEFIAQILSQKLNLLKTEKNINTDIGVAEIVLKELKSHHQVFVVEMGAYKRGEIKDICEIVQPDISILTAISEQHQESFGTLKNTIAAKSEIFENLKAKGLAILNADNPHCLKVAQKIKQRKILYSTCKKADIYVEDIKVFPSGIEFNLVYSRRKITLKSRLFGRHNVSNLLPAIAIGLEFGLNPEQIKNQVKKILPLDKTMNLFPGPKKSILIDDSYNANPDGILAALDYMNIYPQRKKIIVSSGMYELGQSASRIHTKIGEAIGKSCDLAIFININYRHELTKGFTKFKSVKKIIFEDNLTKAKKILQKHLNQSSAILFEGRTTDFILKDFKK